MHLHSITLICSHQLQRCVFMISILSFLVFTGNETCNFFVNGTLYKGKKAGGFSNKFMTMSNQPLGAIPLIGSYNNFGAKPLNGIMDELAIFSKSLTEKDVQTLMNDTCKQLSTPRKYERRCCKNYKASKVSPKPFCFGNDVPL